MDAMIPLDKTIAQPPLECTLEAYLKMVLIDVATSILITDELSDETVLGWPGIPGGGTSEQVHAQSLDFFLLAFCHIFDCRSCMSSIMILTFLTMD